LRNAAASTSLRAVLAPVLPLFDPETSPGAVHLRRATINDLAALVDLENAAFAVERMSARQWRRHLESLSAEIFVAIRERRVIGACVLFFRRANSVARLYSIAVAADERGRGIGETLLVAAEQAARRRGSRVLRLEVRSENTAAQRLYERHGYRRFGMRSAYYEDGQDALRYEKAFAVVAVAQRS
jgi:ribosomal-protein-alanine acetyltransferase